MKKILKRNFFNRDTKIVAEKLIGKFLVRRINRKEMAAMIVETEAYDGPNDQASHAFKGKTKRTEVMFADPGTLYVYLCYGAHFMLNVVTREKNYPAAVLIRGAVAGGTPIKGPGKITKYFNINKDLNGKIAKKPNGIWFEERLVSPKPTGKGGGVIKKLRIKKLPRVGVDYAGPVWSSKKLRFKLYV